MEFGKIYPAIAGRKISVFENLDLLEFLELVKKNAQLAEISKNTKIKDTIKQYQKFIKNNFEYVGEDFAYEARSIHYNNKEKSKGIYGNATAKEVKELKEEGINTEVIPWVNKNDN